MTVYVNTDVHTRHWTALQHPETGRTLRLEPGEEIDLELPDDFEDTHLKPTGTAAKKARSKPSRPRKPKAPKAKPLAEGAPVAEPALAAVGPNEAVIPSPPADPASTPNEEQ